MISCPTQTPILLHDFGRYLDETVEMKEGRKTRCRCKDKRQYVPPLVVLGSLYVVSPWCRALHTGRHTLTKHNRHFHDNSVPASGSNKASQRRRG